MLLGVVNSKGGVGKSTIAVHLAAWLHDSGAKVAMVDADSQSSSTEWIREAAPSIPCYRWRSAEEITANIEKLYSGVDVIVMDGPAGLSEATRTIMMICDGIFIPCGPSILDMRALQDALLVAQRIQATREGGLPVVRLIPNKLQRRYRLSKELLDAVDGMDVLASTGLGLRSAYADAPGQGTVVWKMGSSARPAAQEMDALFKEILNDDSILEEPHAKREKAKNTVHGGALA